MYQTDIYETPSGNNLIKEYISKLIKKKKDNDVLEIKLYLEKLAEFGFDINKKFRPNAIKPLRDQIYELRPSSTRIFFFYYNGNCKFIFLHAYEKKTNKTDSDEIAKAIKEKKRYCKEN